MESAAALLALAEPRRFSLEGGRIEIASLDWGGDRPLALLHHANGFCKGVMALVAEKLRPHFRVVALDARGHGDSTPAEGKDAYAWQAFARDAVGVARQLADASAAPIALGLGHSFGGTMLLAAAAQEPELFEQLVLVDPVVLPGRENAPPERAAHTAEMVDRATRRRADWQSRAEARAWFAERALFAAWSPEALELYVLDGLAQCADGSVRLKCPGTVEAAVFANGPDFSPDPVAAACPVPTLWLWAQRGNFPLARFQELAGRMARAEVEAIDAGHLVPMEAPEVLASRTLRFCGLS